MSIKSIQTGGPQPLGALSQRQELAAIDFADIIGGPLIAIINAQARAARLSTEFIRSVTFTVYPSDQPPPAARLEYVSEPGGRPQQIVVRLPGLTSAHVRAALPRNADCAGGRQEISR